MHKSSKPAPFKIWATISAAVVIVLLVPMLTIVQAQSPQLKPSPPQAHLRFWNMLPKDPKNNLLLLAGEQNALASVPPGNIYADYVPVPVGNYTLIVRRLDEATGALQRLPVAMLDKSYITLVATEKNGQPAVEVYDDTPDPKVIESSARITLRQFFPGARVKVSVIGGPSSSTLDYGETAALENVPPNGQTSIVLQAVLPTTPPSSRTWTLAGDFSVARHATLLLVADSYGRFRPRLTYDGQLGATATALAPPR